MSSNVHRHGPRRRRLRASPFTLFTVLAVCATLGGATFFHARAGFSWALAYLAAVNAATFLAYAYDKLAARATFLRVPEATLHLLAFAGGTLAAIAAQQMLRHKTVKARFRLVFWILAVVQAAIIATVVFSR